MKTLPQKPVAHHPNGFSLVELLVAVLISAIILGVASFVVSQLQRSVRSGLARAQMSLDAQAVNNRIRFDSDAIIGPNTATGTAAGAVVITSGFRQGYIPLPGGQMSKYKVRLRSDQLAFIADQTAANWVNNNSPSNKQWNTAMPGNLHTGTVASHQAMIWYGAIQDSSITTGDGSSNDPYYQGNHWLLGRQSKLLTDSASGTVAPVTTTFGITPGNDQATGTLNALADSACTTQTLPGGSTVRTSSGGWTDDIYQQYLTNKPNLQSDYTNLPQCTTRVDAVAYRHNPSGNAVDGLQLTDVALSNLRLADNCSEIVVQWAGDLDKDGNIDIYPPNHPLAGSIIWYPEEIHDKGSWYGATVAPRLDGQTADIYNNRIKPAASQWYATFPTGFTGPAPSRFGGHGDQSPTWYKGFQLDYGEHDNTSGQTTAPEQSIPQPYVFRFGDGQWRTVRFGFRQDGSWYSNAHDNKIVPSPAGYTSTNPSWNSAATYADGTVVSRSANGTVNDYQAVNGALTDANGVAYNTCRGDPYDNAGQTAADGKPWILVRTAPLGRHGFPYPPRGTTTADSPNPTMPELYRNRTAPVGPFPLAAPLGTTNFADGMGNRPIPYNGQPGAGPIPAPCRQPPTNWQVWKPQSYAFGTCVRYPTRDGTVYFAYNGFYPTYDPSATYDATTNKYAMEGATYYHAIGTVTGDAPSANATGLWVNEGAAPLPPSATDRPDLATCKWAPIPYPILVNYGGSATTYSQGDITWSGNWPYCARRNIAAGTAPAWDINTAYSTGTLVAYSGATYWCQRNIPAVSTAPAWDSATAYPAGSFVSYVTSVGPPVVTNLFYCNAAVAAGGVSPDINAAWVNTVPRNYAPLWDPEDIASSWRQINPPPFGYRINVSQTGVSLGSTGYPARGDEPVFIPNQDPLPLMSQKYDTGSNGDNYTVTYKDLWREYLQSINDPAFQGTRADWRNPQSDWPRLIRMRIRLHDPQGLVVSYSDDFLVNGRDNDGDGIVNNPEEGRMSGIWYEFIFPLPYPRDPDPRSQTK